MNRKLKAIALVAFFIFPLITAGCAIKRGQDFDYSYVHEIKKGESSKVDILKFFGTPNSKGIENGRDRWTYEYNETSLGGKLYHKDIVLIFDDKGKVIAYSHESNFE